jgi:glycosyltransferase involved in cell wall biosynthesis
MATNFGMTGVETFILQLVEAQQRAGMVPSITLEVDGREEVLARGERLGIPVHDFPRADDRARWMPRKLRTARLRARRTRELVAMLRGADVLHMHSVGLVGMDAFAGALIAEKPTIVTHHTTLSWQKVRTKLDELTFWLEKRVANFVVMPYATAADEVVRAGVPSARSVVVPFCVDETRFARTAAPPSEGELTLVMASRMYEGKGHGELLAAIDALRGRYPGLRLVLVGDGPTRPEIEAEIDRRGLRGVVDVRGQVPHDEMPELIRSAHVIVLPSYMPGETFPISLLEGMAVGLPAIGTRWFGIPDIIEDGQTGFVVEPRDAAALAHAIERFLQDPALVAAASRRATERVQRHFTATAVAADYQRLYERALVR